MTRKASMTLTRWRTLATFATVALTLGVGPMVRGEPTFRSTQPEIRIEYWERRMNEINARLQAGESLSGIRLVFLGDSITDFWSLSANPWMIGKQGGRAVWDESFGGRVAENLGFNMGISGDRTEHVLHRLLPKSAGGGGQLDRPDLNPEFVVLMIGINNSWAAENPAADSVFQGIRAVVTAVHERKPNATVILQSLLPTNEEARNRDVVRPVNRRLVALAEGTPFASYVRYLDLYPGFVDSTGQQITSHFMDGVHPSESGYRIWRDQLVPFLERVRASKRLSIPQSR